MIVGIPGVRIENRRLLAEGYGLLIELLLDETVPLVDELDGTPDVIDSPELADRGRVLVDPKVAEPIIEASVALSRRHEKERGGLPAAAVSSSGISSLQRQEQTVSQELPGGIFEGVDHGVDDVRSGQDVALGGITRPGPPPGPGHAVLTSVGRRRAIHPNDSDLATRSPFIGSRQCIDDLLCRSTTGQSSQAARTIRRVAEGLRGDGSDPRLGPGDNRTDGEELGRHHDSRNPRLRIVSDERKGRHVLWNRSTVAQNLTLRVDLGPFGEASGQTQGKENYPPADIPDPYSLPSVPHEPPVRCSLFWNLGCNDYRAEEIILPMRKFDLFVIGSGPAGQRAAVQAAKLDKHVGIVEKLSGPGGVCLNTGTIPSKTFREAVLSLTNHQRALMNSHATVPSEIQISEVLSRCNAVISREVEVIRDQLRRNRVELFEGTGRFTSPHRIAIDNGEDVIEVEADKIIIAVGTNPARPEGIEIDGHTIIDSDGILSLDRLPRTLTVVGSGVIGTEYASMFAALGVEVTVIDKRDRLLSFLDREIADALTYQLRDMNVTFRFGEAVAGIKIRENGDAEATLESGKRIISDLLLYSIGRIGSTASLGLENAGLTADKRSRIEVNEHHQTSQPHIYAVGDVIGFPSLAATSRHQGRHAACHAFGLKMDVLPHLFPYGIYAIPEISMVGQTEEQLTDAGIPYEFGLARYREIARGAILGDDSGMLKLLFHLETRQILGVHIIGTSATELVHIGQTAMAFGGTLDFFVNNVFNYPTFAECYKVAALDGYNKVGSREGDTPHPGGH